MSRGCPGSSSPSFSSLRCFPGPACVLGLLGVPFWGWKGAFTSSLIHCSSGVGWPLHGTLNCFCFFPSCGALWRSAPFALSCVGPLHLCWWDRLVRLCIKLCMVAGARSSMCPFHLVSSLFLLSSPSAAYTLTFLLMLSNMPPFLLILSYFYGHRWRRLAENTMDLWGQGLLYFLLVWVAIYISPPPTIGWVLMLVHLAAFNAPLFAWCMSICFSS
jgi:hypothetical protein